MRKFDKKFLRIVINSLSIRAFFVIFYINFVTQILRNESTVLQSFVYNFVGDFKLVRENVEESL